MSGEVCICGAWPGLGPDCQEHKTGKFAVAVKWPDYRDMTSEQMLAWGRAEQQQRIEDLKVRTPEGLRAAQANAEQRRKEIGAGRSVAATLCMDATRAERIAKARSAA